MGILPALQLRIARFAASWHSMSALGSLSYGMPTAFVCMILRNTICSRLIMEKKTVLEHTRDSTSYQNHSSQTSGIQTFERGIQIENSVRNFLYHITLNGLYPGGTTMRKSQNPSGFNLGLKAEACLWF